MLTQEILREYYSYDPETGDFYRIKKWSRTERLGKVNVQLTKNGYNRIRIFGKKDRVHRLAWLYTHGYLPPKGYQMDHINCDRVDNRLCNLRVVTPRQNAINRRRHKEGGLPGATFRNGRWVAQININGKKKWLGSYDCMYKAHEVYMTYAITHGYLPPDTPIIRKPEDDTLSSFAVYEDA